MPASQTARTDDQASDKRLSNASFWEHCSALFGKELPQQQFDTWIKPLTLRNAAAAPESNIEAPGVIELVAPNRFVQQWIKDRYAQRLESLAREYWGTTTRISVTYTPVARKSVNAVEIPATATLPPARNNQTLPASAPSFEKTRLNRDHSFDAFVTGKANQLARAAANQVAENPGTSYNPLFLYGGVGLGKTHLVQAIGNKLFQARPDARIRYIHAEQYVTDVVRAYQKKTFDEFKRYYHSLDLLIIDDIQFFDVR